MDAATETELKLTASAEVIAVLLADPALFGAATESRQVSTYFDTAERALKAAGLTLRVRAIGDRRVQTIKGEGAGATGLFARSERECDIEGDEPVAEDIAEVLGAASLDPVAPLFRTEVDRAKTIVTEADARIELVADRGHIVAGPALALIGEIELELLDGDPRALFALARRVAAVAPVRLGVQSKSERGFALLAAKPARSVKAEALRLPGTLDAAGLFAAVAATCLRQFRLNEELLLATGAPEPLHQARVALRCLRSALSLFRDMLAGPEHERFRLDLRRLAGLLGEVRDLDVLVPRVVEPVAAETLARARAAALAKVTAELDAAETRALMLDLAEWVAFGAWRDDAATVGLRATPARAYAAEKLARLRRRLKRRGRDLARLDDEARHEVRIVGKKLRYAAEFFADLFHGDKRARRRLRFLDRLEAMQTALGELNDLAGATALLARLDVPESALPAEAGGAPSRKALLAEAEKAHEAAVDERRFWK